jgi:hypothetical protein
LRLEVRSPESQSAADMNDKIAKMREALGKQAGELN